MEEMPRAKGCEMGLKASMSCPRALSPNWYLFPNTEGLPVLAFGFIYIHKGSHVCRYDVHIKYVF